MRRLALASLLVLFASSGLAHSATRLPAFRSPSRNISCLLVPGRAVESGRLLCAIARSLYGGSLQDRCLGPLGGGVDRHGFELGPFEKGSVSCSGGILYNPTSERPTYVILPYGKTWQHGGFVCSSRIAGVTCQNRAGHGLFISRATWRSW